ncbi:MAG: TRAP transporter substrate-binding protein [Aestuariivita sp.]|uniref:TRAP transporter substrate-binding protein n=1 Tax=Aestuariivita sp. TaxID=1872407 RepID=UPI003BB0B4F4
MSQETKAGLRGLTGGAAILAAALTLTAGTAQAEPRTLTITSLYSADKPQTLVWVKFEELLEEKLPGQFAINIITDGALGGEKEEAEGILLGSISGSLSTIANLTTWVPEGALFDMPFMFRDQAHIDAVMNGPIGQDMKDLYRAQGFTVLDFITYGSRNVISKDPIGSPDDVKGKTMRVLPSQLHVDLWASLGANPTAVPITEAYGALETGVVDYMDMTKSGFHALKLFEVAPNLTETNHIWSLGVMYFSNNVYNSLTDEQKAVFQEVAAEASDYFDQLAADEQDASMELTLANGAAIIPTDIAAWQVAMEPFWQSYAEKVGGMDRIRAVVDTQ